MHLIRIEYRLGMIISAILLMDVMATTAANKGHQSSAYDFPKYIGGSLGTMIQDIGYTPEKNGPTYSFAGGKISYIGYWLVYPQGVEIQMHFDSILYQPPGQSEIIRDLDYFKDRTIGSMEILFRCRSENEK